MNAKLRPLSSTNYSEMPRSFERLLRSTSFGDFAANIWNRAILHVPGSDPRGFESLISRDEIEAALEQSEHAFAEGLVSSPSPEGPPRYPQSLAETRALLNAGRAIRVRRLEALLPPESAASVAARSIEAALCHPLASLSCYLSPAGAAGLGPHHDDTHIFTLQVRGAKRWRFHGRSGAGSSQAYEAEGLPPAVADVRLGSGDLLYVPSGFIHDVEGEIESLSLAVVFQPLTWSQWVEQILSGLGGMWNDALPIRPGRNPALYEALVRQLQATVAVLGGADAESRRAVFTQAAMALIPPAPIAGISRLASPLGLSDLVERRWDTPCDLVCVGNEARLLLTGGRAVSMARSAAPALTQILESTMPFAVATLPDSLSAAAGIALCDALIDCDVLARSPRAW